MTHLTFLVVIHKGVEIVIVGVGPIISAVSVRLGKRMDWAVINHMSLGIASPADLKVANFA